MDRLLVIWMGLWPFLVPPTIFGLYMLWINHAVEYGETIRPMIGRLLRKKPLIRLTMERKSLFALGNRKKKCTTTRELQQAYISLSSHIQQSSWFRIRDQRNLRRLYEHELEDMLLEELRRDRWRKETEEMKKRHRQSNPAPKKSSGWREVLGLSSKEADASIVKKAYRKLASMNHPDKGGSTEKMQTINKAMDSARKELGFT